jgi:hypothetical protein
MAALIPKGSKASDSMLSNIVLFSLVSLQYQMEGHCFISCVIYFGLTFICGVHIVLHAELSPENYPNRKPGVPTTVDLPPKKTLIRWDTV